jgi:hypothetical protein
MKVYVIWTLDGGPLAVGTDEQETFIRARELLENGVENVRIAEILMNSYAPCVHREWFVDLAGNVKLLGKTQNRTQ